MAGKRLQIDKINLGCGRKHLQGYINVDIVKPADVVCDITKEFPFQSNSISRIEGDNIFEHFDNDEFRFVLNECYRVLKKGGVLWIKSPDALNWFEGAFADPTHKRFFCWPRSFQYLQIGHPHFESYGKSYGFKGWIVEGGTDKKFITCELTKP